MALTADWRRVLAPHGSIAIELGDSYAGSGGAGGDYDENGLREGQPKFRMDWARSGVLDQSLCGIPGAYMLSLIYGFNVLRRPPTAADAIRRIDDLRAAGMTAEDAIETVRNWTTEHGDSDSPAGRWRVRNLKPWIRSNPPVGALGRKERPATSYVIVACLATDRYFDLDAVRTPGSTPTPRTIRHSGAKGDPNGQRDSLGPYAGNEHPAGAPPLDWWHSVDAIIDNEIDRRAGQRANARTAKGVDQQARSGKSADRDGNWHGLPEMHETNGAVGARGVHIRRRLEKAGILTTLEALDVSPKGYAGAHYAVWPPELVRLLLAEMCPRRVCTVCGEPSRRIVGEATYMNPRTGNTPTVMMFRDGERGDKVIGHGVRAPQNFTGDARAVAQRPTLGWSDCGCPEDRGEGEQVALPGGSGPSPFGDLGITHAAASDSFPTPKWRPAHILDPFAGSGTTLAVASGMGHDSTGIDIDERNAHLALERVGMFLEIDERPTEVAS